MIPLTCIICGIVYFEWPFRKSRSKYCSWRCFGLGKAAKIVPQELLDLYHNGFTASEIGRHFKTGPGTIRKYLRELGISMPGLHGQGLVVPTDKGTLGYIAGFLDGEGTINSRQIVIVNTFKPVIVWLSETCKAGGVGFRKRHKRNWKVAYTWKLCKVRDRLALLQALRPYLLIKREKAEEQIARLEAMTRRGERGAIVA